MKKTVSIKTTNRATGINTKIEPLPSAIPLDADDIGALVAGALRRGITPQDAVKQFIKDTDLHNQINTWS